MEEASPRPRRGAGPPRPSFSTEEEAVTLLYGLVAIGQIQLRKIDGHRHVSELLTPSVGRPHEWATEVMIG